MDKRLAKKEQKAIDRKKGRTMDIPVIKNGGLVIGAREGFKETSPTKEGQVLMGSAESDTGVKWSSDVNSSRMKIRFGKAGQFINMEPYFLEGEQTIEYSGGYNTITIVHKIPNLLSNLLGIGSVLVNDNGDGWHLNVDDDDGHDIRIDDTNLTIKRLASSSGNTIYFRIILWLKEVVLKNKNRGE